MTVINLTETQERYKGALKEVIKLVLLEQFKASLFIKERKISNMFVRAVIQLDYIDCIGSPRHPIYSTDLKPEDVTDEMAISLNDRIRELVKQRNAKSNENKKKGVIREFISKKEKEERIPLKEKQEKDEVKNIKLPKETIAKKKRDIPLIQERLDEMEDKVMERISELKLENSRTITLPEKNKPFYIVDESKVVFKPLTDWSDDHLLMELSKRGYEGTLNKLTDNGTFNKMETIELGKKKEQ